VTINMLLGGHVAKGEAMEGEGGIECA